MNFEKESKSEEKHYFWAGGGRGWGPKKNPKTIGVRLFFVLMLYIKFQVPGSSGSLVLTQAKRDMDR